MTPRNRARLRQFDDPENVRRLIDLPQAIVRALPREGAPSYAQAIRVQSALAISILTTAPMRMKNLASLRLGRHVVQTRPGGVRHIVIPAEEVKNRTPLAFEVSDALGAVMDVYLARCRPLLSGDPEGFLFPARKGGAKTPGTLAEQIKRTTPAGDGNRSQRPCLPPSRGALVPPAASPANTRRRRLLLGHKDLNTTVKFYCGLEQADALRRYDALIDRYRKKETRMTRRPPIADWPARDRELWNKAVEPGGLFGGGGAGAHWSAASRVMVACGYNAWLSWLAAKELLDPNMRPADRVTRERVEAYIAEMQAELAPYTVLCRVQELYDALRVMEPESNWKWLAQLYRSLKAQVRPSRDKLSRLKPTARTHSAWRTADGRSRSGYRNGQRDDEPSATATAC